MRISGQPSPTHIVMDQKQLGNVEYLIDFGSLITNDAKCAREIKSRIAMTPKQRSTKKTLFTNNLDLNLRNQLVKSFIWSIAVYGADPWTLGSFEVRCWGRMDISCTARVRIEELLRKVICDIFVNCNWVV